jgi:hypothetical protein
MHKKNKTQVEFTRGEMRYEPDEKNAENAV